MPKEFRLQDPGEGVHEAEIIEIKVSEGDRISEGDPVFEIETDKAAIDVPSPFSGTIEKIHVGSGDIVEVGGLLITFKEDSKRDSAGNRQTGRKQKASRKQGKAGKKKKEEPEGDSSAAETRTRDEERESSSGKDRHKKENKKEKQTHEKKSAESRDDDDAEEKQKRRERSKDREKGPSSETPVPASPATRRLARELNVNLRDVNGGGPGGRVTTDDVQRAAQEIEQEQERPATAKQDARQARDKEGAALHKVLETPSFPDFSQWGEVERQPLRGVRRTTARRMAVAWSQIPHVTHHDVADITELEKFRQQKKTGEDSRDVGVSITVLVLKAVASALKEFPTFNASLDTENEEVVLKKYYNIGIAVDTDKGLLVPVVRDVDRKSAQELSGELTELAERAREGKIKREAMQGGSFTITNPGPIGGTSFTPLINYPEVAILGLGQARLQAVVEGSLEKYTLTPRLSLPLCLAFDHRVNDGAEAARFVNHIRELLVDPQSFLMGV